MQKSLNILRYASDIHLELGNDIYSKKLSPLWDFKTDPNDKYYLALLGDIGNPFKESLDKFLSLVSPKYNKIFYVPGNHEYYNLKKTCFSKEIFSQKLVEICEKFNNILLMDNKTFYLDGIKIIGTTLWSNVSTKAALIMDRINDYRLIKKNENGIIKNITVSDTNSWNKENIEFLRNELLISKDPCIVLTHHAPLYSNDKLSEYTADPRYLHGENNQVFHNDLSYLFKHPVIAWLYGHTHYAGKFIKNNILVATNQLGYISEQQSISYDPYAYIDLDKILLENL